MTMQNAVRTDKRYPGESWRDISGGTKEEEGNENGIQVVRESRLDSNSREKEEA